MNKLIIPIIIAVILAAGIGAYFIFQKSTPGAKCGDGVCQKTEERKNSCPQDCKETPHIASKTCAEQGGNICSSGQSCLAPWLDASDTNLCCSGTCQTSTKEKTCAQQNGKICNQSQTCSGSWLKASDSDSCCSWECKEVVADEVKSYGIYELMHEKQKEQFPDAHIDYPYLSGAIFGMGMVELEPTEGKFDFSQIDKLIQLWQAKNKNIVLGITVSSGGGGTQTPEWVFGKGAKYIDVGKKGNPEKQPILWDPIFLAEYEKLISQLANKYDGNPGIEFIIIGTGAFSTTAVNYPAALRDADTCQRYEDYGYSDKLWCETILKMVDINQKYFKKTPLALGFSDFHSREENVCLPNINPEVYNYLTLIPEVANKGIYIYIHHLGHYAIIDGTPEWGEMLDELKVLAEAGEKTRIVLGMDNPTAVKTDCGQYRFGEPEKIIDYAFGGFNDIPEINTSYLSFYEQDLDAAEDGKIEPAYTCGEWQGKFGNAFKKAYENWEGN